MKELICFYKNNQFIISQNYERLNCPDHLAISDFLNLIEKDFFSNLKIVQINFEHDNQQAYAHQVALYPSAKASVFILKEYELRHQLHEVESLNDNIQFESMTDPSEFIQKTNMILQEIKDGRIYQVNLTSPLKAKTTLASKALFSYYQKKFNGNYKALLPLEYVDLLSFSPELFLQQEKGYLKTQPIKGSLGVDEDYTKHLLENKKEDAELSMIVDLLRNDLNSLSNEDSAVVVAHREKMRLGYIQHTYSEIKIKNAHNLSLTLQQTFPGGSISGCPKIESLHVIREIEKYKRQAYTGALGWWKEEDFALNITIRSFIKFRDELFYHAGCGIVYDSNPEAEWQEYLLKTGGLHVR